MTPKDKPSIVVTAEPDAWAASTVQDLTATPSMSTVQAPHWVVSHPTWVPVSPSSSRRKWTSSVRAATERWQETPFTVIDTVTSRSPVMRHRVLSGHTSKVNARKPTVKLHNGDHATVSPGRLRAAG